MFDFVIKKKLSKVIETPSIIDLVLDRALQAAAFIPEAEYVREAPANHGKFRQGIRVKKVRSKEYLVESTARNSGKNYPFFLYTGTGRMKGKPDFGFHLGRVRAGDVARGIGGIRPNKAAHRAKEKSKDKVNKFILNAIKREL
jgi:hypothetical protein